ncbi:MAG TPA: Uma2 family endonuclease [Tepidisphaeraceae bacterium]|jgi:Uma2 family endonuclease|nr:Uma2 family endonuclease [Tepidisphaeraceae bacterium]
MTTSSKLITADELLKMGDIGRCELIYGELVMMSPAGAEHGIIANRLAHFVTSFVDEHELGAVFTAETGFKLDRDLVRAPDVSFVRSHRIPKKIPRGFFEGPPDLAIEVISPDDTKREMLNKKDAWLAHGAISVWIVDPRTHTIAVHHIGEKPVIFKATEELTDERALPSFVLPIARVFKLP